MAEHKLAEQSAKKASQHSPVQRQTNKASGSILTDNREASVVQKKPNKTGLPDQLKAGMESVSGMSLDHVKVHYNSPKPAQVQAHAFAQGSDIHLASGQEKHLPHELGHVVQQMQGRVKPTTTVAGTKVNDDKSLEHEADKMGAAALQRQAAPTKPLIEGRANTSNSAQLVSYKGKVYTAEKGNMGEFQSEAARDLNKINPRRDADRDSTLLRVLGNSDKVIKNAANLHNLIHPQNKKYQVAIKNELKKITPPLAQIRVLSTKTIKNAPKVATDKSLKVHDVITHDMQKAEADNTRVSSIVTYSKKGTKTITKSIDDINKQVDKTRDIKEKEKSEAQAPAAANGKPVSEKSEKKRQAKLLKEQQKREDILGRAEGIITDSANKMDQAAGLIPRELGTSADEQYLRGSIGVADSTGETYHLNLGKKSETQPYGQKHPKESSGILWAGIWSHAVNHAFIEGGTDNKHTFKLISALPEPLRAPLEKGDVKAFKITAKKGAEQEWKDDGGKFKDGPWSGYYHVTNEDWTTLAKEIIQLLQSGYVLEK